MIGKLNHVAVAVDDIYAAIDNYRSKLGATVRGPVDEIEHGVSVAFVDLPNSKVELISPLGNDSPIKKFLAKNPLGGIHHICYEVSDIIEARDKILQTGARVLGSEEPKIGAHGKRVLFLNPKDFAGTLIELEEM